MISASPIGNDSSPNIAFKDIVQTTSSIRDSSCQGRSSSSATSANPSSYPAMNPSSIVLTSSSSTNCSRNSREYIVLSSSEMSRLFSLVLKYMLTTPLLPKGDYTSLSIIFHNL